MGQQGPPGGATPRFWTPTTPPTNCRPEAPWGGGGGGGLGGGGVWEGVGFWEGVVLVGALKTYAGGHPDAPRNEAWIQRLSRFPQ